METEETTELEAALERAKQLQKENDYACAMVKRDMLCPPWLRALKTGDPR